ncbi:MAG: sigma-70 family RNA polymerase sigma factor [Propionibacteriaceae bacterium]|nr:sigma-70 family RNA polymerase sigma factor [Propionibacteriaceae bacterium]
MDFSGFVALRLGDLVKVARSLTADPSSADDLTQIALEKAYRSWGRIDGDPFPYVRRILVNSAYDAWRRKARLKEVFGLTREPTGTRVDEQPELAHDAARRLDDLMRPLAPRERAVITLRYLSDLTEADTARELGMALGTVKSTHANALKKMRVAEASLEGVGHGHQ